MRSLHLPQVPRHLPFAAAAIVAISFAAIGSASAFTQKTIHSFCATANCADGAGPVAPVIIGASGNVFGTASKGGANGDYGTVSELKP